MDTEEPKNPFESISIAPENGEPEATGPEDRELESEIAPSGEESALESGAQQEGPLFPRERSKVGTFSWLKWPAWLAAVGFVIYLLAGYILVPYLCRSVLARKLSVDLARPVTIGAAEFNPLTLTLILHNGIIGPRLTNPGDTIDPILSFSRWEIDMEAISLIKMGLVCREVRLDRFFLHAARLADSTYNVSELLPSSFLSFHPALPFRFALNNIRVTNSRVVFDDLPAAATHTIDEINLALPVLSNFSYKAAGDIRPEFSARINGSPVTIGGRILPRPDQEGGETRLELKLNGIDLPAYFAYLPDRGALDLAGGRADLDLELLFSAQKTGPERLQLSGTVRIADLRLQDTGGNPVVDIPELTLDGAFVPLAARCHLKELVCTRPELHVERTPSWRGVMKLPQSTADLPAWLAGGLTIDRLQTNDGLLVFVDRTLPGRGLADTWTAVQLTATDYAVGPVAGPEKHSLFEVQAEKKNGGAANTRLKATGSLAVNPRQLQGSLEVTGLALHDYAAYWHSWATGSRISQTPEGWLDFAGEFSWPIGGGAEQQGLSFAGVDGTLRDLTIADGKRQWLAFSKIVIKQASLDTAGRIVDFGRVTAENGKLNLSYDAAGKVTLPGVIAPAAKPITTKQASDAKKAGWTFFPQSLNMNRLAVRLERETGGTSPGQGAENATVAPMVVGLDDVVLQFSHLAGPQEQTGRRFTLTGSTVINRNGRLQCAGTATLTPFGAELDCSAADLELGSMAAILPGRFAEQLKSGRLHAKGAVRLPAFSFAGTASISDFKSRSSVVLPGRGQAVERLRWRDAVADKVRYSSASRSLDVETITVQEPRLLLNLQEHGETALQDLLALLPAPMAPKSDSAPAGLAVQVGEIVLAAGEITLADRGPSPPYVAGISNVSGSLAKLDNASAGLRSRLALQGVYDGIAPLKTECAIGLFTPRLAAACEIKAASIQIAPFSPYLAPLLGREIVAGTFDVNADYRLVDGNVAGDGHLDISGFKSGAKSGGLDQLPMLAALLTDQKGHMALDVPINGSTSDPAFSVRGSIIKVLRSMLLKSAAAPFSLFGSLIGPEQPEALENQFFEKIFFPAGTSALTADVRKKLQLLAQIAHKRPLLALEVAGYADGGRDRQALLAERKKRAAYQQVVEEIRMSEAMTKEYGKEEIAPPRNGGTAVSGVREKGGIAITDGELLELAAERGRKVQKYLVEESAVAPAQVTLSKESKLIPADTPGRPGNRVDFRLRALQVVP